jgi:hypothetical protein
VKIVIARATSGRVSGKSCVAPTKKNRKAKKCTRYVTLTTLARTGRAGKDSLAWNGHYGTRKTAAPAGSYRATATAAAGLLTSKATTLGLKILKG